VKISVAAKSNLESSQNKMKMWYDRKSRDRQLEAGEQVLVLLPGQSLQAKFSGPYTIDRKLQ
jgi:hypothetical protein